MYRLLLNEGPKSGLHESRVKRESYLNITTDEELWADMSKQLVDYY